MFRNILKALSFCLLATTFVANASVDSNEQLIKDTLMKNFGLNALAIGKAPFAGFHEVMTEEGVLYVSDNGQYLIQGNLLDIKNKANLTQQARMKLDRAMWGSRLDGMKEFEDSMIIFPAENEKYQVTIFTDITCFYCRKLHAEMDAYNKLGITVRYLAYPRSGLMDQNYQPTANYTQTQSVWCSANQKQALTDAKNDKSVATKVCENRVADHYQFGRKSGVNGTPAIVLDNGMLIPGYKPAADLKEMLDIIDNS